MSLYYCSDSQRLALLKSTDNWQQYYHSRCFTCNSSSNTAKLLRRCYQYFIRKFFSIKRKKIIDVKIEIIFYKIRDVTVAFQIGIQPHSKDSGPKADNAGWSDVYDGNNFR